MKVEILNAGFFTSIQDLGRTGFQKYGIIVSGAMDIYALRIANILVGNSEEEAAMEITLSGPEISLQKGMLLSITGADISPTIEGNNVPMWRPVYIKENCILKFGACKYGCRAYITFAGGFKIGKVMGSKSTYIKAGIGGYKGRILKKGDILELESPKKKLINFSNRFTKQLSTNKFISPNWYTKEMENKNCEVTIIRIIKERQFHSFTEESLNDFFHSVFSISIKSDRMGYRLTGAMLQLKKPLEMISEAVYFGTIQVPPEGNPIILLADRQTTGGYPKIAQVISVDIPKIAQLKPNEKIRFQEITLEQAEEIYFHREKYINYIKNLMELKL